MELLEVKGVTKVYNDARGTPFQALADVNLQWRRSECIAIMGESGCGKSTLARLMLGLERPTAGCVCIDGMETTRWTYHRWRGVRPSLQAVFQDSSGTLNPAWSTARNVTEGLRCLTNLDKKARQARMHTLMAQLRLEEALLATPVRQLSGGQQRRLALVRALAVAPDFLILDEVTAGLDLLTTEAVVTLLTAYRQTHDCALFLITHDEAVASRLCNRLYVMAHGRIVRSAHKK